MPHTPSDDSSNEEICLLGPQQLSQSLRFVARHAMPGHAPAPSEVAEAWRRARSEWLRLEKVEAGIADEPVIRPLPKAMQAHVQRLAALPAVQQTFDTVPVAFGMVPLAQLVVSQYSITGANEQQVRGAQARRPSPQALASLCLPLDGSRATMRLVRRASQEWVFESDAHDLRFLGAQLMATGAAASLGLMGHPQAAVALGVGFSANLLNVVHYRGRLVLNNGHHRALALQRLGLSHVPCLVQACGSSAELGEAATQDICDEADLYFEAPRPPMLRDFDNPALTLRIKAARQRRQVRLSLRVESQLLER